MLVLGIETSCDETAAALVDDGLRTRSSVVHSQVERHRPFGGVVPEIAAREHVTNILPVLRQALDQGGASLADVDLIAVTDCPGLVAALLSGVAAAEAIAVSVGCPLAGVNHIEAHLVAPFLAQERRPEYPLVSLVASGGHTHLFHSTGPLEHQLLGATIDDAAGEAFDKIAKVLGLDYPGGPAIQAAAEEGDPQALDLRRPFLGRDSLDFSFSGLKTAVLYKCLGQDRVRYASRNRGGAAAALSLLPGIRVPDVAASFQAAVVDVLVLKLERAVDATGVKRVGVGGGVACNGPLRERLAASAEAGGWELLIAPHRLCTDNAAMIASRGQQLFEAHAGNPPGPKVRARASWTRASLHRGES